MKITQEQLRKQLQQNIDQNASDSNRHGADAIMVDLGVEHAMLPVDQIDPSPYQPRILIRQEDVDEKADDIRTNGQIQAIQVRRKLDGRYELIDGEHRWRAMMQLNEPLIRAEIKRIPDREAVLQVIAANLKRKGYHDFEMACSIKKVDEEGLISTVNELAAFFGCQVSDIYRFRAYFELPEEALALLQKTPGMINRVAAEKLKSVYKNHGTDTTPLLLEAMGLVHHGEVPASKIDTWLLQKLGTTKKTTRATSTAQKIVLASTEGTPRGTVTIDTKKMAFKADFKDQELANEFEQHVRRFFEEKQPTT